MLAYSVCEPAAFLDIRAIKSQKSMAVGAENMLLRAVRAVNSRGDSRFHAAALHEDLTLWDHLQLYVRRPSSLESERRAR